ncbi:hypothetical protein J5N97_024212 [Dioscorea zingiberensis]|uniref:Subtilisin-like protease SBT1.2 n=1 Tax=Dioscorea zingiberensis TaxID=325984 RepID=A0A9D5C6I9_9LILI|nr:hypothetical protein J5N97_024212 [Dioscorea zingiberensis]
MSKQFPPFILVFVFLSTFSLFSCCHNSHGFPAVSIVEGNASKIQTYIVHVESPGKGELLSAEDRRNWHESFLPSLHLDSGEPRLVYSYTHAISGFAARLKLEDVKAMEAKEGFLHAQVDKELEILTTYTPAFSGLNQWKGMWWDSDFGAGMIIGVIDTGILPTHPSFSDDGMSPPPIKWRGRCDFNNASLCNNKLIGARSFKAGYDVSSPLDEHGHGTHTAGTVAGSRVYDAHVLGSARGSASGIAPKAHLAIYKVVHNNQGFDSDLLAAIDQAILDGVDVLSISLGRVSEQLYDSAAIVGSLAAMERGVLTCGAAGNNGPYPSVIANDAPWMLTVGAGTTDRRITVTVKLGNEMEVDGEAVYQMNHLETTPPSPIAYPGYNGILDFKHCKPNILPTIEIQGKIVICWADNDGNVEQGIAVKRAGGAGMILLNSAFQSATTIVEAHVLPAAHLSHKETMKFLSYIDLPSNTCPTATIITKGTSFRAQPSPAVASFSSRGPSLINGGILKPDMISPGVNILAAWPLDIDLSQSTPFNFMSGTSVSTAHIAGIAAMLRSTHPEWSPAMIKSAIMTTAYTQDLDGNHITSEYPDNAPASDFFALGAGHVNPSGAQDPGLVYDIEPSDYINYLCGLRLTDREVSVIARQNVQCSNVQKIGIEELNYPSISLSMKLDWNKTITRNVTNVGEAHSVYFVHVDQPEGATMEVSPDILYFTRKNQKRSFTIEFGTKDDYTGRGRVSEGQLLWVGTLSIHL